MVESAVELELRIAPASGIMTDESRNQIAVRWFGHKPARWVKIGSNV
jgi:hypothetical protein